jgi:hypothetical protein
MSRRAGDICCLLASLLLWSLLLCVRGASSFTHQCTINVDGDAQVSHAAVLMPHMSHCLAITLGPVGLHCNPLLPSRGFQTLVLVTNVEKAAASTVRILTTSIKYANTISYKPITELKKLLQVGCLIENNPAAWCLVLPAEPPTVAAAALASTAAGCNSGQHHRALQAEGVLQHHQRCSA